MFSRTPEKKTFTLVFEPCALPYCLYCHFRRLGEYRYIDILSPYGQEEDYAYTCWTNIVFIMTIIYIEHYITFKYNIKLHIFSTLLISLFFIQVASVKTNEHWYYWASFSTLDGEGTLISTVKHHHMSITSFPVRPILCARSVCWITAFVIRYLCLLLVSSI